MKRKMVFMLLWGVVLSSLPRVAQQVTNKIYIPEMECGRGKTINVPVAISNDSEIVALQFDVQLPSGSTITGSSWSLTDRKSDHSLSVRRMSSTHYLFVVYSLTNTPLRGNSGNLINFSLQVPENWEVGGKYPFVIENPILSARDGSNVWTSSEAGALIMIADPRPDVAVSTVKVDKSSYAPSDKIVVSWLVTNEGDKETGDGWSEQVSLVADNGEEVYLGKVYYESILGDGGTVNRQAEFTLSDLPGVDGMVKAKVKLIPGTNLGELAAAIGNNTAYAGTGCTIAKKLRVELPTAAIKENNTSLIRCKLYRSGTWANEQVFSLRADKPERLNVPQSVTIPAGQSGGTFYIHAIDNEVLNVDSVVTITIEGNGYETITGEVHIIDDELPALTLIPSKTELTEGDTFTLTVERESKRDTPLTVYLSTSHKSRFKLPAQVMIPAGEKSVAVEVLAVDDNIPDVTADVDFTVSADGYNGGKCIILLNDNDVPQIQLSFSTEEINESAGSTAIVGRVTRITNLESKITVKLAVSSQDAYLSYETLVFPAGVSSQEFSIGVVDNALKDGDREVIVTASVYLPSCNCSATATSGGHVTKSFKILDDDGPSLSLTTSQPTILEGVAEGIVLKVTRNNTDNADITVTLTSDNETDLVFDKTVIIPAGVSSVDVKVYAKANDVSEGDRTSTIIATSEGYTKGICWVMITDQTLPDVAISYLALSKKEALAGDTLTVSAKVINKGAAELPAKTKVMVYLTSDQKYSSTSKKTFLTTLYTQKALMVGEEELISRNFALPDVTGKYSIVAIVNEDHSVKELTSVNNVSDVLPLTMNPKFSVTASVGKEFYQQGEEIVITGKVSGVDVANAKLEVYIISNGAREVLQAQADSDGNYTLNFKPASRQMGHFMVGACYPGEGLKTEMASFDIYGIRRTSDSWITWNVTTDEPYTDKIAIFNPCNVPLTNVKAELVSLVNGCQVEFDVLSSIPANSMGEIAYTVTGNEQTNLIDYERMPLKITTAEGASLSTTVFYHCKSQKPVLRANVSSIHTTVTKGTVRDYSVILTNTGKEETGVVSVVLPSDQKWMTSVTPLEMPSIAGGDSAVVVLRLATTDEMQLNVPVTGTIGINCRNGNGIPLSYSIEPVSETKGTLVVDVKDEYTYFTDEAPHVEGAKVVIMHPVSRQVIYEGVTGIDGLFTVGDIPEGYYAITVTAEKHDSYSNNLLVDPGKTTKVDVDLTFQAITYDWNVVETEIQDEYEVETVVKYETNVPVPVVVTTYPSEIYCKNYIFNLTLTNKGLITAQNVTIDVPEVEGLKFELLCENPIAQLRAQESIIVPVRVTAEVEYDDVVFTHSRITNTSSGAGVDDPSRIVSYRTKFKSAEARAGWGTKCLDFRWKKYWEYYCSGKYKTASDYYDYFYGPNGLCNKPGSGSGGPGGGSGSGFPSLSGGGNSSYGSSSSGNKVSIEICSKKNNGDDGADEQPEEQPCEEKPVLKYKLVTEKGSSRSSEVKGVAADGQSKVKIILDVATSKIPSDECGYTVKWTLSEDLGHLENADSWTNVIYVAPENFPEDDKPVHTITARMQYSSQYHSDSYDVNIEIIRVPVVMIHGLNSDETCFAKLRTYLKASNLYRGFQLNCVDYSTTNCAYFAVNALDRKVADWGIKESRMMCMDNGYVSQKADLVGHSMGGILSRLHVQYVDDKNVHKLITLNTPHSGSPLGDVFGPVLDQHPIIAGIVDHWIHFKPDAINDLALDSKAIDDFLNNDAALSKMNGIPVHALTTAVNVIDPSYVSTPLYELAVIFKALGLIFYDGLNDGVVSLESQKGGLNEPYTNNLMGPSHTDSPNNATIHKRILSLLNQPSGSTAFSMSGFRPVDLHYKSNVDKRMRNLSVRSDNGNDLKLEAALNPTDNRKVDMQVETSSNILKTVMIANFSDGKSYTSADEQASCDIPATHKGRITVYAIGIDQNDCLLFDSVYVDTPLQTSATPVRIALVRDSVYVAIDEERTIHAMCYWDNGDQTMVEPVITIEKELAHISGATLIGEKAGTTTLKATYEGLVDQCVLRIYDGNKIDTPDETDPDDEPSKGVCSTISLSFKQTITVARQAFRGTLTMFNGHEAQAIDSLQLNLEVRDNEGKLATSQQFAVSNESIDHFGGKLKGPWTLEAKQTGTATILFVPSKYAAPTEPKEYSFGGTITYKDPFTGLFVTRDLYPVTLTVKPCPDLSLSYFVERDVFGDDPETAEIEPSIPAEFSLLINNVGYGDANSVKIATGQPEIVDNQKGLAIHFEMIGFSMNGQAATADFANLDFGSIQAGKQAYAQWYFTSSLLGHFTEYNTTITKGSSYGNEDFNLLSIEGCHELIRSLKVPNTSLTAFMVNDIKDANDLPDCVYLTDGTVDDRVTIVSESASCSSMGNNQYTLTLSGAKGWVYGAIHDPTNGRQKLASVTRMSDDAVIDLQNFWQTDRTLRDGKDPLYENNLRFADYLANAQESYVLTFTPKPDLVLEVESFGGIPTGDIHSALTEILVTFNKPINTATFTADDLSLYCQNTKVDLSQLVIEPVSDTQYKLDLSLLPPRDGYHVLTVQTEDIEDLDGFCGSSGKNATWNQFVGGKVALSVVVTPEGAGVVTPKNQEYVFGTNLELKAEANEGYDFACWKINGEKISEEPVYKYQIVADRTIKAEFKAKLYDVTIDYDVQAGIVSLGKGVGKYEYNTDIQLSASPNAGYVFNGWRVDGEILSTDAIFSLTIKKNVEIEAVFTKIPIDTMVSYELPTGWNWFSINVKDENLNNPVALLESIKQSVVSVLGQEEDLVYDDQYGLYGSLTAFKPDRGYKVRVKEDVDFSLKGIPFAENEVTITLNKGWNWMGYTPNMEMSVNAALCNLMAEEGDIVMAQDQFATYDGAAWKGSLSVLAPGNAYLYYSGSVKSFNYPTGSSKMAIPMLSYRASESYYFAKWQYDKRKYADNMGVISRLYSSSGQELPAGQFRIGAFTGEECRGMSSEADGYQFVTVHGEQTNEKVTFRAYNTLTGEEFDIKETIRFGANVVGSLTNPFILHLGSATGLDKNGSSLLIYPNPVKDRLFIRTDLQNVKEIRIIDMKGSVLLTTDTLPLGVGLDVTSLTEGIYFITIQTDTDLIRQKFVKSNRTK